MFLKVKIILVFLAFPRGLFILHGLRLMLLNQGPGNTFLVLPIAPQPPNAGDLGQSTGVS